MDIIEYIKNVLNLDDYNVYDIHINDIYYGKGLKISNYILTLSHIIEDNNFIYVHDTRYNLLLNIEFYDICVLSSNQESNINIFIDELENFIEKNCLKLHNHSKYKNTNFKIYNSNHELEFIELNNINLKTYLYPAIPMGIFEIKNMSKKQMIELCESGISGSLISKNNKYFGLVVSQNENNSIEIMPFEIIHNIIKTYINNNNNFYYLKLPNNNIVSINDKPLVRNQIFIQEYNFDISLQTYILLFCNEPYVNITKTNNNTEKNKLYKYNFNNMFLNYKENNLEISIFDFVFKELSEEFLIKNQQKNISDINYDNIFNKKKLLYLEKINNKKYCDYIDTTNNIYVLNKISGHNINKLSDINKYLKNKKITFELINPNNDIIKIKI